MHRTRLIPSLPWALALALAACATAPQPAAAPAPATTQEATAEDTSPKLPRDPAVRTGTLDNGLRYYIRQHKKPEKRAYLWLAVNAGSVLEDDDQKGLAHFVEHMAFNGTERFEKNTLIDFLEKAGMDFGADLNAFTSFDETVYQLKVPTDDATLLSSGFDILEDWAGAVTFDPIEVDKERGVVVEEWRLGRGANQRAFDKQWPIFLAGSKYADRKPIGEKKILETAPVDTLKRFYRDWYRPDNMAVIVVGDIDPARIEADLHRRFKKLPVPEKPRPRQNVPVPLLEETRAAVFTDPEMTMTRVGVAIKGPVRVVTTEDGYRERLVERLFHGMLRSRLDELRRRPDSPFTFAFSSTSSMGRAVDVFNLMAGAKAGKVEQTLQTLLAEVERVRRHGFVAAELDRQKARTKRRYERSVAEKDKVDGRRYAFGLVNHFLEGEALPSPELQLELAGKFLPTVTLEEVNALAGTWTARTDRVLTATGPARDKLPGKAALLAVADSVKKLKINPYVDKASAATLLAKAPKPGSITKTSTIPELDLTVWELSNGVEVVVKPTDFKNDEVVFQAFSPGGHSLVGDKEYHSASFADDIVRASGVAEHDAVALRKMLAGKVARVSPFVGELEEGLRGSASPQDLETMMQLVHLNFTAPRTDKDAYASWKSSFAEFVKNRDLNPQQVFFEKLSSFSYQDHLRRRPTTLEVLDAVDHQKALEIYRDRFADAGDFTFVFVGNVEVDKLEPLVTTYLGSLPTTGRKEKWKDVGARHPKGIKSFEVNQGQDPKSFVWIDFHGKQKWSAKAEDDLEMLSEVMDIRLREVLREEMSGVYGAFSRGSIARRPKPQYDYYIGFGCSPDNVDKLKKAVLDVIASIKKSGVSKEYVDKVRELRRRKLETDRKENRFWLRELAKHYRYGTDPKKLLTLDKEIERVSSKNIQAAARRYLNGKRYIEGTLYPAEGAPKAKANPADKATKPAKKPSAKKAAKPAATP